MSEQKALSIPVIQGTTRPRRKSIYAAKFIVKVGETIDHINPFLVDPKDFQMPFDGNDEENKDPIYTEITQEADAFFIVLPEYNHSFPGTLKRFLDSELKSYVHKPVAFAGVSAGPWGGVRAIESLVPVVRELGLVATFRDVNFPNIGDLFDDSGEITNNDYIGRVEKSFDELVWMARSLKWGRDNLAKE